MRKIQEVNLLVPVTTVKAAGDVVDKKDKLSGPTSIKVTAEIEAGSAKSGFEGQTTLEYVYHVVKK